MKRKTGSGEPGCGPVPRAKASDVDQLQQVPGVHVYDLRLRSTPWVRYDAPLSSVEMMKYLYERGLNVRPGTEFELWGEASRFTFAPSVQDITDGVAIFKAAMQELRS